MNLIADLGRALAQMGDPRFLRVLLWAVALTVATLAALTWAVVAGLGWVLPDTLTLPWVGEVGFLDEAASWAVLGVMLVLSVVLMVPTAAAVVGFFLDAIAEAVEARHYPGLPPAADPGIAAQLSDSLRFLGLVALANLLALIVYLVLPPLAPFTFWAVNGFLLGREYFTLVAMRRLSPAQAVAMRRRHMPRIWLAGIAMAVPLSVPLLNLVVPVLGVAVFTHQFHRMVQPTE
jgi:CysZ protein